MKTLMMFLLPLLFVVEGHGYTWSYKMLSKQKIDGGTQWVRAKREKNGEFIVRVIKNLKNGGKEWTYSAPMKEDEFKKFTEDLRTKDSFTLNLKDGKGLKTFDSSDKNKKVENWFSIQENLHFTAKDKREARVGSLITNREFSDLEKDLNKAYADLPSAEKAARKKAFIQVVNNENFDEEKARALKHVFNLPMSDLFGEEGIHCSWNNAPQAFDLTQSCGFTESKSTLCTGQITCRTPKIMGRKDTMHGLGRQVSVSPDAMKAALKTMYGAQINFNQGDKSFISFGTDAGGIACTGKSGNSCPTAEECFRQQGIVDFNKTKTGEFVSSLERGNSPNKLKGNRKKNIQYEGSK